MLDLMGVSLQGAFNVAFTLVSVIVAAFELVQRLRVRRGRGKPAPRVNGTPRSRRRAIARAQKRQRVVALTAANSNRLFDRVRYELSG